jgi:hypothetical protein
MNEGMHHLKETLNVRKSQSINLVIIRENHTTKCIIAFFTRNVYYVNPIEVLHSLKKGILSLSETLLGFPSHSETFSGGFRVFGNPKRVSDSNKYRFFLECINHDTLEIILIYPIFN